MPTTMTFIPTPQARKVYDHLKRKKLIPDDVIITGALTLEQAQVIPDDTLWPDAIKKRPADWQNTAYRDFMIGTAVTTQREKTKTLTDRNPYIITPKPYKSGQKIELGSDTEGRRVKDHNNSRRNDVLLYAEAMGISEEEAHAKVTTHDAACNGHAVYLSTPVQSPATTEEATPMPDDRDTIIERLTQRADRAEARVLELLTELDDMRVKHAREMETLRHADPPAPIPLRRATIAPDPSQMAAWLNTLTATRTRKGRLLWLTFDAKPDAMIRDQLKSYGFRWSSKRSAWWLDITAQDPTIADDMAAG